MCFAYVCVCINEAFSFLFNHPAHTPAGSRSLELSIPTLRCMQRSSDDSNPRWPQVAVAVAGSASGWLRRAQAMGVGPLLQSGERVCLQRSPPRRTSPVPKIWLRWKRLFFRVCEIATPIGLDDARTHVEEFCVGSSINMGIGVQNGTRNHRETMASSIGRGHFWTPRP